MFFFFFEYKKKVPEVQGSTQDVAREKVKAAALLVGGPCITEVSGKK